MDVSSQMKPPNNHGTMDESDSESSSSISSISAASDYLDDTVSCTSSDSSSSEMDGPLYDMNSLKSQLPFKRGLSKFFGGKSQSFTSLTDVKCLDDLAKPENPYRKKMKSSHSYGASLDCHRSYPPPNSSRCISKKPHKGNFASLMAKKGSFLPTKPPVCPFKNV
eukprot:Gb_22739 [translate_table: standard]